MIDDAKRAPTVKMRLRNFVMQQLRTETRGNDLDAIRLALREESVEKIIVRISREDYARASRCLPAP